MPRRKQEAPRRWGEWSLDFVKPRGRWRVRPPASVDPKRSPHYFKDRGDALLWIVAERARLAALPGGELLDPTLEEWLAHWYTTTADAADWSENTRLIYREHLWYWSRAYGIRLRDLRTIVLNRIVGLLRTVGAEQKPEVPGKPPPKAPRPLSSRSIRGACATLERAIEAARDDGLIGRNPAASMIRPRVVVLKPTIWSLKERRRVYAELEKESLYPVYLLQVENGLRVGEVLALQWSDIDWERRVILVRRTVHRNRIQEWPKNRKPREVSIGRYSLAALILHRDAGVLTGPLWVFQRADGQPVSYNRVRYRLLAACKRAGITYRPTHTNRHIHVTELLAAGIPAADVADRVGHTGLGTLGDYAHPDAERTRQIVDAASAIVASFQAPAGENRATNGDQSGDSDDVTRREAR